MAAEVRVELEPPPWIPSGMMEGVRGSLEDAAEAIIDQSGAAFGDAFTVSTSSSSGGWPSEPTVLVYINNVDLDSEFGSQSQTADHTVSGRLGL